MVTGVIDPDIGTVTLMLFYAPQVRHEPEFRPVPFSVEPKPGCWSWRPAPKIRNHTPKRDLIIADTIANGRAYARERHIRKPLIGTMEPALRGAMLSCFRLHMVNEADWRPGVMKTLLICADGEPLNSFLADN
jgi:hypothetical protein